MHTQSIFKIFLSHTHLLMRAHVRVCEDVIDTK